MKKKILTVLILSAMVWNISACNRDMNKEETVGKEVGTTEKTTASERKDTQKSSKKIDPAIQEFTSKYLDVYNQEGNAFIEVLFRNRDFVPDELWNKVNVIRLQEEGTQPHVYKMIISCDDNVLYRMDQLVSEPVITEANKANFYLSKGEFFIVEAPETIIWLPWVSAYKSPDFYADDDVYFPALEDKPQDFILHDVAMWRKEANVPLLLQNEVYFDSGSYKIINKQRRIDLDGDGQEERLYFWGERSTDVDMEMDNIKSKLLIDNIEFPIRELFDKNSKGEDLGGYSSDILAIEVIDIDPEDEYKEILLKKVLDIHGGMYYSQIYRYQDKELHYMGGLFSGQEDRISDFVYPEEAAIKLQESQYAFGFNYTTPGVYRIEGGKLVKKEYDPKQMQLFDKRLILDVKEEINLYDSSNSNQVITILEKGDKAIFLETDNRSWIKIKSFHSEEEGYLLLKSNDQYEVSYPNQEHLNGKSMFDLFLDLPIWD